MKASYWPFSKPQPHRTAQEHGFLEVKGNRIVGQDGNAIVLRGMSLFWSQWQPDYFTFDTVRWLKDDWGITVIRAPLGVHYQGYLENPDAEYAKIDRVIEAAIDLGIYVVVDWHTHLPETDRAVHFFGNISEKYGKYPNIIYEPWNEPSAQYSWRTIKSHHTAVIEQIRTRDPRNLIVAGTQNWCRDVDTAANDPLPFSNLAYALHFYAASHGRVLRDKAERALRMGSALLVTEWGTCREDGDGPIDRLEVKRWWHFLTENQIGSINWSVCDRNETSAALKPGARGQIAWHRADISESGHLVRELLRYSR